MTLTFALSNHKGGVAKTTSCLALGACLAESGAPTLIVDLDSQAHLTLAAGVEPDDLELTLADLLGDAADRPEVALCSTAVANLWLLPADVRLAALEHELVNQPDYEMHLARLIQSLAGRFEYVLFDCPPALGGLTLMALSAADYALIPVPCDFFATRGLMRLSQLIEVVRVRTNPRLAQRMFVTLYDGRTRVSQRILAELQAHFGAEMLTTVIQADTRVRESALVGEPVTYFAPRSRASRQYRELCAELLANIQSKGTDA